MANPIAIFNNQGGTGTSEEFKTVLPDSKGFADTEFSCYLEIFGGLGGGSLVLNKKCVNGTFKIMRDATNKIATEFPDSGDVLVVALNYKSGESFTMDLVGAIGATLTVGGINFEFV